MRKPAVVYASLIMKKHVDWKSALTVFTGLFLVSFLVILQFFVLSRLSFAMYFKSPWFFEGVRMATLWTAKILFFPFTILSSTQFNVDETIFVSTCGSLFPFPCVSFLNLFAILFVASFLFYFYYRGVQFLRKYNLSRLIFFLLVGTIWLSMFSLTTYQVSRAGQYLRRVSQSEGELKYIAMAKQPSVTYDAERQFLDLFGFKDSLVVGKDIPLESARGGFGINFNFVVGIRSGDIGAVQQALARYTYIVKGFTSLDSRQDGVVRQFFAESD